MRASDDATGADIAPQALQVLHADDHLLAFDKPSGLLSVPGRGADKQDCLASRVQARWPDARVVHRLDQATSGVILLARGLEMQRRLNACFADRRIDKRYIALVDGWPSADAGTVDLPLQADWPNRPKQHVDHAGGKPALTGWQVLSRGQSGDGRPYARLALVPETGRTHQLRVHLQAIGHPILGDALYAPPRVAACAPRLLLHAETLAFDHPATGTRLEIAAAAPF
ncbi:pseudouridine synthase for 23S rRNA (position 746) and tRNAphe(position 32) [Luteimonas sp. 9C]|uniref:RluA family pseudouridine synthase n=1 Tax=Luteimonas sp. 9C TaxID=2653148 RepID=UPI0012F1E849|nr:RluA family pseudouridine synthase [Luteimonas sp. 9C]VXC11108.1 pseudouridine synthase for 23S rRNA (position 746) and tRNAphe(position 32) [Luteimonas sp. 9C]